MDLPGNSQPRPRAGRSPPDPGGRRNPDRVLHRARQADGGQGAYRQWHHPVRARHLRPGGRRSRRLLRSSRAERRRARPAAAAVPPTPWRFPHAARRGGGLFAHAEACGFGHRSRHRTPVSGSIKYRVLNRAKGRCECCGAGCCLANPASKGPGGGPHRAEEPWRLGRLQQPAGPLLPLPCRLIQRPKPSISSSIEQPSWPATSLRICRKVPTLRGFGSASCDFLFDGSPHSHGAAAAR